MIGNRLTVAGYFVFLLSLPRSLNSTKYGRGLGGIVSSWKESDTLSYRRLVKRQIARLQAESYFMDGPLDVFYVIMKKMSG
jgi:hypothetical protein